MSNSDTVLSYLTKIIELKDQPFAFVMKTKGKEIVFVAQNDSSHVWEAFVQGVCAQENLPTYEKLQDIFVHKETRQETVLPQNEEDQDTSQEGEERWKEKRDQ